MGGGYDWGGCDFFDEAGLFKTPASSKKIAGLITHYFEGNRTPKLGNSDFETTSKQGLNRHLGCVFYGTVLYGSNKPRSHSNTFLKEGNLERTWGKVLF